MDCRFILVSETICIHIHVLYEDTTKFYAVISKNIYFTYFNDEYILQKICC